MRAALAALSLGLALASTALAEPDHLSPDVRREPVDTTRLDVARLPPEASRPARALYARGWFVEAQLGARAFAGDARSVGRAGPRFAVATGYEATPWLSMLLTIDASLHATHGPTPPAHTSFELLGATLGVRFTAPLGPQSALWLGGSAGIAWSSGDVLRVRGFRHADNVRPTFGGEAGFDWHLFSRHHSLGVLGGALVYPGLRRETPTVGAHGAGYLRYVF